MLTTKTFGRGRGIMCGSFLGAGYSTEVSPTLERLVDTVCALGGIARQAKATAGCLVRTARSGHALVVFLFNPFDKPKDTELTLRQSSGGPARDLLAEKEVGRALNGKPLRLTLQPREAKILLIEASCSAPTASDSVLLR